MHKVLECLRINCYLRESSVLVDIGAGLGRPLLHALLLHNIAHAYGVELDRVKVAKADAFCKGVVEELSNRGVISNQQQQGTDARNTAASQQQQLRTAAGDSSNGRRVSATTTAGIDTGGGGSSRRSIPADSAAGSCDQSTAAATGAGCGGGAKGRKGCSSKAKGSLKPPHSTPIITCASIEQVSSVVSLLIIQSDLSDYVRP
eukprot:GHUV01038326.1.p1 GENE.GHUV01038326.1~~GHUV01038326.1.p1  ORF type:complete len:203 (+),score=77.10 GHUV01038326.1:130-738(+)